MNKAFTVIRSQIARVFFCLLGVTCLAADETVGKSGEQADVSPALEIAFEMLQDEEGGRKLALLVINKDRLRVRYNEWRMEQDIYIFQHFQYLDAEGKEINTRGGTGDVYYSHQRDSLVEIDEERIILPLPVDSLLHGPGRGLLVKMEDRRHIWKSLRIRAYVNRPFEVWDGSEWRPVSGLKTTSYTVDRDYFIEMMGDRVPPGHPLLSPTHR